jgi:phenylpyruvate tautomerase PptA (4-oxalocrotonate tautomerase family)
MKQWLMAVVLVWGAGMLTVGCSKARKVETDKLTQSFASAPAEVKAEVQKAMGAIKTRDFTTALTSLKKVVDAGNLTEDQKQALSDTVTDITVIVSENPPANSDELFDLVAEITEVVSS